MDKKIIRACASYIYWDRSIYWETDISKEMIEVYKDGENYAIVSTFLSSDVIGDVLDIIEGYEYEIVAVELEGYRFSKALIIMYIYKGNYETDIHKYQKISGDPGMSIKYGPTHK